MRRNSKSLLTKDLSRTSFLRLAAGVGAALISPTFALAQTRNQRETMLKRPIPSSGEPLPVIGCGTYVGFDVDADSAKIKALADVVRTLRDSGGKVFDSSPMYGRAEAGLGGLRRSAGRDAGPHANLYCHQSLDARTSGWDQADGALVCATQGQPCRPYAGA